MEGGAVMANEIMILREKIATMQAEIYKLVDMADPKEAPCDCCENGVYGKNIWSYSCDCLNYDDCGEAAAWCRQKNMYESMKSGPI